MFSPDKSYISSSGSQHRTYETHRTEQHSYTTSQDSSTQHMSTSSSTSKKYRSDMNNKAKKSDQSRAADRRAERSIKRILEDAKSRRFSIEHTTEELMRVVRKYNRGDYNDSERPSTSQSTFSSPKPTATVTTKTQSIKLILKKTEKPTQMVEPEEVGNQMASFSIKNSGNTQEIPRELAKLRNSDGYVEKLPTEWKRTPKKVLRFSESLYKNETRSKRRASTAPGIKEKGIEKKIVRKTNAPSSSSWFSPSAFRSHTTSVTETNPFTSVPQVERTSNGTLVPSLAQNTVYQKSEVCLPTVSSVRPTISQATTVSVPGQVKADGNFMHNRIKITHYPMIEVKLEC